MDPHGVDPFLQDPPHRPDRWRTDRVLRHSIERLLPPDTFEEAVPELQALSVRAITEMPGLDARAERNRPRHVPFDPWGRRIDLIDVDPAWLRLVEIGQEVGLVAIPYEDRFGPHARVVQCATLDLFTPASATADCPLAMTDAAARVLLNADGDLAERYVPRLTAREDAWTSGQWMTEKEGGSDVGRTGTVARDRGDGTWTLHGTKWFTSATTADIALALARPEGAGPGSGELSLFLLELRDPKGGWNGIVVRRLKDKLGTWALPTAELELDGTVAVPVGGIGAGVKKISAMLNVTRLHAAMANVAVAGFGLGLARDFAYRREAFGRRLADLPVHRTWMARVSAEYEAMNALAYRAADLLGAVERGTGDPALARIVLPLAKMAVTKQGVWVAGEIVESFGGAGYVEDTGIPRMLRDSVLQSIWEGTTSVMALDVMRALVKENAGEAFLADIEEKARVAGGPLIDGPAGAVLAALEHLRPLVAAPTEEGARRLAWGMARTYEAALLCEAAGWALDKHSDSRAAHALSLFAADPLVPPAPDPTNDELGRLAFGEGPPEETEDRERRA